MPLQVEIFLEHTLNGLTLGALYALVTLGLVLTFSVIDLVNFAHGDLFMMAGFTTYLLLNLPFDLPYLVIIVLVIRARRQPRWRPTLLKLWGCAFPCSASPSWPFRCWYLLGFSGLSGAPSSAR